MKKVITMLLVLMSLVSLFAETRIQTIVLVSVVEKLKPDYFLEVVHVENEYAYRTSKNGVLVTSHNVQEDVKAHLCITQSLSRYNGEVKITVSAAELGWFGNRTNNLIISGNIQWDLNRTGYSEVIGKSVVLHLSYNGKHVGSSVVGNIFINYKGNKDLPQGIYNSLIKMVIESN